MSQKMPSECDVTSLPTHLETVYIWLEEIISGVLVYGAVCEPFLPFFFFLQLLIPLSAIKHMLISAHLHTTLDGKLVKIIKRIRSSLNDVPLAHICIMISKYSLHVFLYGRMIRHTWEVRDDDKKLTDTSVFNADAWFDISVTVIHRVMGEPGNQRSGSPLPLHHCHWVSEAFHFNIANN